MTKSGFAAGQLKSLVERVERLESEKAEVVMYIRDVYVEAKSHGFDVARLREIIRLRRLDATERQEREAIRDLYCAALGMEGTPLGDAATVRLAKEARPRKREIVDAETGEITGTELAAE